MGGAASFYSKQATPNPELTIFAQALALILYASSGENLHPPPRPRNRLRQEKPIPVFYFGVGRAIKRQSVVCGGGCVRALGLGNSSDAIRKLDEDEKAPEGFFHSSGRFCITFSDIPR